MSWTTCSNRPLCAGRRLLALSGLAIALLLASGCPICRVPPRPTPYVAASGPRLMNDRETGLSWSRQIGDERSWEEARAWCEALEFAERDDWRLPSLEELRRLYDTRFEQRCEDEENPCRVDPALELGGAWFWSGSSGGAGRRYYIDFRFGTEFSPILKPGLKRRVLCVADAKTCSPER